MAPAQNEPRQETLWTRSRLTHRTLWTTGRDAAQTTTPSGHPKRTGQRTRPYPTGSPHGGGGGACAGGFGLGRLAAVGVEADPVGGWPCRRWVGPRVEAGPVERGRAWASVLFDVSPHCERGRIPRHLRRCWPRVERRQSPARFCVSSISGPCGPCGAVFLAGVDLRRVSSAGNAKGPPRSVGVERRRALWRVGLSVSAYWVAVAFSASSSNAESALSAAVVGSLSFSK